MKVLKNFNKSITFVLAITYFVFAILAIVFGFSKELFVGDDTRYKITSYALVVGKTPVYTYPGIISFANNLVDASTKTNSVSLYFNLNDYVDYANTLKVLTIIIFVIEGLFVVLQIPSFRHISNVVLSTTMIVLLSILKSKAITNFKNTSLIVSTTKSYNMILAFWIVVLCVTFILLCFKMAIYFYDKKQKGNQ